MNEPKTREQFYWAGMAGQDVELPAPKTRTQEFMKATAERMAQGGGGDMKKSAYDEDGSVAEAGGIALYVESHGSGLPDPSSYTDGTVLIKVGNEWKAQSGYGYEEEPAFEPIEWDGSTEGRENIGGVFYKVSDAINPDCFIDSVATISTGSSGATADYTLVQMQQQSSFPMWMLIYDATHSAVVITEDITAEGNTMKAGVYFQTGMLKVVPANVTVQFDEKYIKIPEADRCVVFYLDDDTEHISAIYINGHSTTTVDYSTLKNLIYSSGIANSIPVYFRIGNTIQFHCIVVNDINLVYGDNERIEMSAMYVTSNKLIIYSTSIKESNVFGEWSKQEYTLASVT